MPFTHKHGECKFFGRGQLEAEIQVGLYANRMLREGNFKNNYAILLPSGKRKSPWRRFFIIVLED